MATGSTQQKGVQVAQAITPIQVTERSKTGDPNSDHTSNANAVCLTNCSAPPNELWKKQQICSNAINKYRNANNKMQDWETKIQQVQRQQSEAIDNLPWIIRGPARMEYDELNLSRSAYPELSLPADEQRLYNRDRDNYDAATNDMRSSCLDAIDTAKQPQYTTLFQGNYNANKNPNTREDVKALYANGKVWGSRRAIYYTAETGMLDWSFGNKNGIHGNYTGLSLKSSSALDFNDGVKFSTTNSAAMNSASVGIEGNRVSASGSTTDLESHFNAEYFNTSTDKGGGLDIGASVFTAAGKAKVRVTQSITVEFGGQASVVSIGGDAGLRTTNKPGVSSASGHFGVNLAAGGSLSAAVTKYEDDAIIKEFERVFKQLPQ